MRSIFYISSTYSLFKKIELAAKEKDLKLTFGADILTAIFVILTVITNLLDLVTRDTEAIGMADYAGLSMIFIILLPLYIIQGVANKVNNDPYGKLNSSYFFYNIIFIVLGIPLWLLIFIGILNIDLSFLADPV